MQSKHRAQDVERFDRWGSTYERSWLQQRLFDPVHAAILRQAESRFKQGHLKVTPAAETLQGEKSPLRHKLA